MWKLYRADYDGFPLGGVGIVIAKSESHALEIVKENSGKRGISVTKLCELGKMSDRRRKAFFTEIADGDY